VSFFPSSMPPITFAGLSPLINMFFAGAGARGGHAMRMAGQCGPPSTT
jgi:hypothetical protein